MKILIITALIAFAVFSCHAVDSAEVSPADSVSLAQKHLNFAIQYKKTGQYEEARIQYEKSLQYNPNSSEIHISFADLLLKSGDKERARAKLLSALQLEPQRYELSAHLATLYYEKGMYDSTLVMYEKMNQHKPNIELQHNMAKLYDYVGEYDTAIGIYKRLIDKGELSEKDALYAANLSFNAKRFESAKYLLEKVISKNNFHIEALSLAARAALAMDDEDSAAVFFRRLVEQKNNSPVAIGFLEKYYKSVGDSTSLAWVLDVHHKNQPQDVVVLGNLASLYFSMGDLKKAETYASKGVQVDPQNGLFRILLGEVYRMTNQLECAVEQYEHAAKDEKWRESAEQLILVVRPPDSEEQKNEQLFFNRTNPNNERGVGE